MPHIVARRLDIGQLPCYLDLGSKESGDKKARRTLCILDICKAEDKESGKAEGKDVLDALLPLYISSSNIPSMTSIPPNTRLYLLQVRGKNLGAKDGQLVIRFDKRCSPPLALAKEVLRALLPLCDVIGHNLAETKHDRALKTRLLGYEEIRQLGHLSIEIGFGSGRHLLSLAKAAKLEDKSLEARDRRNFLGIEVHDPSIRQLQANIELFGLENLGISSIDARLLVHMLDSDNIDAIFLHFPIPWPSQPKKRVVSKDFLTASLLALRVGGYLHIRSDEEDYYLYSKELASSLENVEVRTLINANLGIISKYEARWRKQQKDIYDLYITKLASNKTHVKNHSKKLDFIGVKNLDALRETLKKEAVGKRVKEAKSRRFKALFDAGFLSIGSLYKGEQLTLVALALGEDYMPQSGYLYHDGLALGYLRDLVPTRGAKRAHEILSSLLKGEA